MPTDPALIILTGPHARILADMLATDVARRGLHDPATEVYTDQKTWGAVVSYTPRGDEPKIVALEGWTLDDEGDWVKGGWFVCPSVDSPGQWYFFDGYDEEDGRYGYAATAAEAMAAADKLMKGEK